MYKSSTDVKLAILILLAITVLFISIFADKFTMYDPYLQNPSIAMSPPSREHFFGTDQYGRDVFSRVIMGSRTTLLSALFLVAVICGFGTFVGVTCGYIGGKIDSFFMRISDIFLAFPSLVFALAIASVLGGGIINAVIALAMVSWPKYARISRGLVLSMKNEPFIHASIMNGSSTRKIIIKHILPNIIGNVIVMSTLDIGTMIMELAGLSFLGLGAMPPTAEWGAMMSSGRSAIQTTPWVILAPGFAIFISVTIFNLLGDKVRDTLEPRK